MNKDPKRKKKIEVFLYPLLYLQFVNCCWERGHLNSSSKIRKKHLISPLFMQNTNTVSSKTDLNLTRNLWGKVTVSAIRQRQPHHFVS